MKAQMSLKIAVNILVLAVNDEKDCPIIVLLF